MAESGVEGGGDAAVDLVGEELERNGRLHLADDRLRAVRAAVVHHDDVEVGKAEAVDGREALADARFLVVGEDDEAGGHPGSFSA